MKKVRHEISLAEVNTYVFEHVIASSSGNGAMKRLTMQIVLAVPLGWDYIVTDHDNVLYEGCELADAIEAYNRAP